MYETRARGEEFIDRPDCDPDLALRSYRFMQGINRRWGGIRTVRRFIATVARERSATAPLRLLDIGCGSADIPLALLAWAHRIGLDLRVTGLETSPHAVALARAAAQQASETTLEILQQDVFSHDPATPYDCAVASMMAHHLDDTAIIRLLGHLRDRVRGPVLINDLHRAWPARWGACLLLLGAPPQLRHDALLSIRRGFRPDELAALLGRAPHTRVTVRRAWCLRIAARVDFLVDDR